MPEEISFNFTPQDALEYFRRKEEQKVSWSWKDVWEQEHKRAFTVAKMTKASMLDDVQKSLDKALADGQSYEEWRSEITKKLDRQWLGRTYGSLWDEMSPEEQAKHDEPSQSERLRTVNESRLTTIFRTNMFSSYQAGRYRQLMDDKEDYPYWRYVTMEDGAVRPAHRALHGKIFRWDDTFWDTHYPPNGFNCRCEVEALDDFDLQALDLKPESGSVTQMRTDDGKTQAVYKDSDGFYYPCDKGWSYNVGKTDVLAEAIENKEFSEPIKAQLDNDLQEYIAKEVVKDRERVLSKIKLGNFKEDIVQSDAAAEEIKEKVLSKQQLDMFAARGLKTLEENIKDLTIEHGAFFDSKGNAVLTCIGDKDGINNALFMAEYLEKKYPNNNYGKLFYTNEGIKTISRDASSKFIDIVKGGTYTHNHPSSEEIMLSQEDIEVLFNLHLKCMRAVSTNMAFVIKLDDNMIGNKKYKDEFVKAYINAWKISKNNINLKYLSYSLYLSDIFKEELQKINMSGSYFIEEV